MSPEHGQKGAAGGDHLDAAGVRIGNVDVPRAERHPRRVVNRSGAEGTIQCPSRRQRLHPIASVGDVDGARWVNGYAQRLKQALRAHNLPPSRPRRQFLDTPVARVGGVQIASRVYCQTGQSAELADTRSGPVPVRHEPAAGGDLGGAVTELISHVHGAPPVDGDTIRCLEGHGMSRLCGPDGDGLRRGDS